MRDKIMVTQSSMPEFDEYVDEIRDIWDSVWLTNMGTKHRQLQKQLSGLLQVPEVSLFCNGHMALELTLQAFELSGQVITTPYSFASTTHAIVRNNLTPVFCDIREDDYTIDIEKLEALITPKTTAIVPVHVYGNICDNDAIMEIAHKHRLKVIYDAAHAFCVEQNGVNVAAYGDASMFSFHATKVFHTIEGGAVASSEDWLHRKLYQLKNFGIQNEEVVDEIGANAKMNEFQAAMGLCNLRHIYDQIHKRKRAADRYRQHLEGIPGIKLCREKEGVKSNYAYFPVVFDSELLTVDRDAVWQKLKEENIFTRKYFYPLTSDQACFKNRYKKVELKTARELSQRVLVLPVFEGLKEMEQIRVIDVIKNPV